MAFTPATENLIQALQGLPGVGIRSAQRMALQMLERDPESGRVLAAALGNALAAVRKCPQCRTLTESELCETCADEQRDSGLVCVVASDIDRAGIEMSAAYSGRYFVLHGTLSPIDGIGPQELGLDELIDRVRRAEVREVLIALDDQLESQATVHFLREQLKATDVVLTRASFGQLKSGALDKADSRAIEQVLSSKQTLGFEHD